MLFTNQILIGENNARIAELRAFRELLSTYHKQTGYSNTLGGFETDKSRATRQQLNTIIDRINAVIIAAGVSPRVSFNSLVAKGDVNVITNAFTLTDLGVERSTPFDFVDRAIGRYECNARAARIRTFNPFFYLGFALEYVASLPFRFLARMGVVSRERSEGSKVGRIVKTLLELVAGIAALIAILQAFGVLSLPK